MSGRNLSSLNFCEIQRLWRHKIAQYTTVVQATSNSSTNTEDLFVELKAAASTTIAIKRVRVSFSDGTDTAGIDNHFRVKLVRYTTTTGGTTATPTVDRTPRNANATSATATSKGKSGTTACALGTGSVTVVDLVPPNGRALYEFLARDDQDMIVTTAAGCFCVAIQSSVVSQKFTVTVDHVE